MKKYNKLVRDKILEIIKADSCEPEYEILQDNAYLRALYQKFDEEVQELKEAESRSDIMSELSDILELIDAVCDFHKISRKDLLKIKKEKFDKRGGFKERILLKGIF